MTKLHRLEENLVAANFVHAPGDFRHNEDAAAKIAAQGARYTEAMERITGR